MNPLLNDILSSEQSRTEHALKFATNPETRDVLQTKLREIALISEKTKNIINHAEIVDILRNEVFKKQNIIRGCNVPASKKRYVAARDIAIIILYRFKEPGE